MEIITWNVPDLELECVESSRSALLRYVRRSGKGKGRADYVVDLQSGEQQITLRWDQGKDERGASGRCFLSFAPMGSRRSWRRLEIVDSIGGIDERYKAYQFQRACRDLDGSTRTRPAILIYHSPDNANFMAFLPDYLRLGDIAMPGTHESCALYGYPISQCHRTATPIAQQLTDGVRFFDVRLKVVGNQLLTYHGIRPERSSLPIIFSAIHSFLDSHPTETIIVLIKEETPPFHPDFTRLLYKHFQPYIKKYWFLEDRIPTLGEVRGRAILASRFDSTGSDGWEETGVGIHPSTWPDSYRPGFEWWCGDTKFRIQDWYRVQSFLEIPEKFSTLVTHLEPTLTLSPRPQFTLSYSSASSFPFSFPTVIAKGFGYPQWGLGVKGMNTRFTQWLLERIADGQKVRACVMMDFYRQEGWPGELLVLMNLMELDPDLKSECI